ncbi:MAG TPA: nucleotidyltransferase [Planktothrix sp.]
MVFDPTSHKLEPGVAEFYRHAMNELQEHGVDFLVGGAYALRVYTEIERHTKDLDLFVRRVDRDRALAVLEAAGYKTEVTFPHWLGKAYHLGQYIDIIYSSGNGLCDVDDEWFNHAIEGDCLGVPVRCVAPEEMIWPKAFIMERERFDGADIAHVLHACAKTLDWNRLIDRMGDNWRALLSHLILFGYIYPGERANIPEWVMTQLMTKLQAELSANGAPNRLCQGTLLSRAQYLVDVESWGYRDARMKPRGSMSEEEIKIWTQPIKEAAA